MSLKEKASQYITDHGIEAIASALQVKETTVKTWQKTGKYPLELIELMQQSGQPDDFDEKAAGEAYAAAEGLHDPVTEALLKIAEGMQNISLRVNAIEQANVRPEPRPVAGPRVIAATSEDGEIAFQETARLGGNKGFETPVPTDDPSGAQMRDLLTKRQTPAEQLAKVLASFGK